MPSSRVPLLLLRLASSARATVPSGFRRHGRTRGA